MRWRLAIAKLRQIPRPSPKRLALLINIFMHIVGGLDSFASMIENSLSNVDLDAQLCEAGSPGATQVMRCEGGDAVLLESFETSGDAARDLLRVRRRRSVSVRQHVFRAGRHHLELLEFLDCPIGQRQHVPPPGFRVFVGDRPILVGEVELAPLSEGELAATLQREQEHQ